MKKFLTTLAFLLLCATRVWAATITTTVACPATGTSTGCVVYPVNGNGSIGIQVSGSFSGTLQFEATTNGTDYVAFAVYASGSATSVTSTTAAGAWVGQASGYARVRVRASAFSSGSAVVDNVLTQAKFSPFSPFAPTVGGATAQTSTNSNVVRVTVGSADADFWIGASVNCTSYDSGNLNVNVVYTDETNASRTVAIQGHFTSGYGINVSGTGSFEGQVVQIRAKAATTITITTSGTFTLTYNVRGVIAQIAA